MPTRLFYSEWQLACCGDAFSVGDHVSWTAHPADASSASFFGPEESHGVDWYEEHHQEKRDVVTPVEGTVAGIRAVWQRHDAPGPRSNALTPVHGDVVTAPLTSVVGWSRDQVETEPDSYLFVGYLIELS